MPAKPSVLIIDSDAFLAGIYARKFEADGWNVSVAESLADGEKIRKRRKLSALVVEPDIDQQGTEALIRTIRAEVTTKPLPIAVLSTLSERQEIDRMKKAGADAYLIKGHFVPTEAVRKVRGLLIKDRS